MLYSESKSNERNYKMSKNQDLLDASEIGSIPGRKSKKTVDNSTRVNISGISGLLLFAVCISILYMAYMVIFGTDDIISQAMTAPALLFVIIFLVIKSLK